MRTRRFLTCLFLVLIALPAVALDRPFPLTAARGKMTLVAYPDMTIDGKIRVLSRTVRIWNENNRLERASHLRGDKFVINYTVNNKGEIDRIWILNAEEASHPLATQRISQTR